MFSPAVGVALGLALRPDFKVYQQQVIDNCQVMVRELMKLGYHIVSGMLFFHI
jgi:glycine hydroxymethyltransferase